MALAPSADNRLRRGRIDGEFAQDFAREWIREWIEAWKAHGLRRISMCSTLS